MALTPLATPDDLEDRGIDVTDTVLVSTMLAVASAEVRGAAGSPISEVTSTVRLTGRRSSQYLRLPGPPVQSVTTVLDSDSVEITDAELDGDRLWRYCGWGIYCDRPYFYNVTYVHGLPEVPADIVDLVCSLAAAGLNAAADGGYGARSGVIAERIDDYSVQYAQGADAVANVMEIPARTRRMLRARFGASAGTVASR